MKSAQLVKLEITLRLPVDAREQQELEREYRYHARRTRR